MKQALYLLTVFFMTISCNGTSKQNFVDKPVELNVAKKLKTEQKDTIKEALNDSKTAKLERTTKNAKKDIVVFIKTIKVKTSQYEIELIDPIFKNQLDSLIKFEKKCLTSTLKRLYWTFLKISSNKYELTAHSDFGGIYQGYTFVDNSLVFLGSEEPMLYKKTDRKRDFVFDNKSIPFPEDY